MCEQLMNSLRENLNQPEPLLAPMMVHHVQTPPQESKDAEPSFITQNCDETNKFDDPTVQQVEDIEIQSSDPESQTEWDSSVGLMLYNVSRKYGLDWAVPGGPTMLAQSKQH